MTHEINICLIPDTGLLFAAVLDIFSKTPDELREFGAFSDGEDAYVLSAVDEDGSGPVVNSTIRVFTEEHGSFVVGRDFALTVFHNWLTVEVEDRIHNGAVAAAIRLRHADEWTPVSDFCRYLGVLAHAHTRSS